MKILMVNDYFPPEIGSASHLFYELAKEFVKQGDEVSVITGFPRYNIQKQNLPEKYKSKLVLNEKIEGINVFRIKTLSLPRQILILRGLNHFLSAFVYFLRGLAGIQYDYILVYSPPLPLGLTAYFLKVLKGKKVIFNVQDLFPQEAIDMGMMTNKLMTGFFYALERFVYNKSDLVTVHSDGNKKYIEKVIQDGDKVRVIHNWVNTEELSPGIKNNEFSSLYKIDSKFVVSFAGILGHLQDFEVILQAAKNLEKYNDIEFIIVGDGVAKGSIEENIRKKNIRNVRLIPMQPKDKYPQVLHSSDVGLVTLVKDLKTPVIPSKILSIMSSAKPVLATMLLSGDAPKIIKESKGGFFYDAGDAKGLTEGILFFYNTHDTLS